MVMISAVMLLCHDPARGFDRTDVLKSDGTAGSARHYKETERHFPSRQSIERLSWIVNLLISIRGIGWNFGSGRDHALITKELNGLVPSKWKKEISITKLKK